ncbi:MAG: hypothetical protein HYY18_14385 [Planctomycetes bacterium]|nr:hypothetical protein [Planctomycetota bacterium]
MSEPVVVNTGPIVALSCCGCLSLLASLHAPAIIPEEVSLEIRRLAAKPGFAHLASGIPGLELR